MTDERKAAILSCLAVMPFFVWLIFPGLTLGGLLKLGAVCVVGAGVAMAIPCKEDKQNGEG